MSLAAFLILPLAGVALAGALFHPLLGRPSARVPGLIVISAALLAAPILVVPLEAWYLRAYWALVAAFTVMQLYDAYIGARVGAEPRSLGSFVRSLYNPCHLVPRRAHIEPRISGRENARRFASALVQLAIGWLFLQGFYVLDWHELGFVVEHTSKAVGFFVGAVGLFEGLVAIACALGGDHRAFSRKPYIAVTPADFWRRYNRIVGQFLHEDVFRRIGGGRWVVEGTLVAFLVSALIHEYVFSVPVGGVVGYMTAFFMLQGLAVVLTLRVRPHGWRAFVWGLGTFVFNIATSVFFFAHVDVIVPFYANPMPLR